MEAKKRSILIKNVLLDSERTNILIEGNRFTSLSADPATPADKVIDGTDKAILPPFYNTHTHAAMTLLRGYADDMPLDTWLREYIWPKEESLTPEDIYQGSVLAIREMIKSGCVFFNDMYFEVDQTIRAVADMGVRACIGVTFMDAHSLALRSEKESFISNWQDPTGGRISIASAPHAIYTCSEETLRYAASVARKAGIRIHIHLAETAPEVADCYRERGMSPVKYLDSIGLLGPDVIAAHCVHLDAEDIALLAARGVTVSHCPCSNMKLGSGIFRHGAMADAGVNVTIGTDGCSSNNNLDMREEMKFASLLAKCQGNPECLPAPQALRWATEAGARAFGIDAGVIAEGKLAVAILVDLRSERMHPLYHLVSNWVYSAESADIDTVICDGRILMEGRQLLV